MKKKVRYQFTVKNALNVLSKYKSKTPLTREILDEIQKEALAEKMETKLRKKETK